MELKILDWLQTLHTPVGDTAMCLITKLGDAGILWILLTLVLLILPRTRRWGVILAAGLVVDLVLCNVILKPLVARIRPFDVNTAVQVLISKPKDYSFPSGHTAASFTAVAGLYLAGAGKLWKPALVLAVLIAFSRLYLYVHYPTDVLGGIIVGFVSGYVGYRIILLMEKRRKIA